VSAGGYGGEGGHPQSAAAAYRAAVDLHRLRHPRRHGLSRRAQGRAMSITAMSIAKPTSSKRAKTWLLAAAVSAATTMALADGVDRALLLKKLSESWPTYSGDYSGRRYSALRQINRDNVHRLTLAWTRRLTNGPGASSTLGPGQPGYVPLIVGGEGTIAAGGTA